MVIKTEEIQYGGVLPTLDFQQARLIWYAYRHGSRKIETVGKTLVRGVEVLAAAKKLNIPEINVN